MVDAWRSSDAIGTVHIMQDQDAEETYQALYIEAAARAAGIRCKRIKGLAGLRWNADGQIVDAKGELVRAVWKTWAWETALDQIRAECESDDAVTHLERAQERYGSPRLVDVLLNPQILVYETLWKLPQLAAYRVQICTFTARGKYAGSCIRADQSLIITTESDIIALRVLGDDDFVAALGD